MVNTTVRQKYTRELLTFSKSHPDISFTAQPCCTRKILIFKLTHLEKSLKKMPTAFISKSDWLIMFSTQIFSFFISKKTQDNLVEIFCPENTFQSSLVTFFPAKTEQCSKRKQRNNLMWIVMNYFLFC